MKERQPTELQLRILERVQLSGKGAPYFDRLSGELEPYFYRFYLVHPSNQVTSRAVNLCRSHGWLREMRGGELRLTVKGRKALDAGKRGPS